MSVFICLLLLAALHAAQICRYLVYSEADFGVFCPAGATRCTDGCEIWHGGGDLRSPKVPSSMPNLPPLVQRQGCRTPKLKFLLRFGRNVEHKRFQDVLGVKILLDLLKVLWSYGGFKLRGSACPQIFSAPLAAKLCQTTKRFGGERTCSRSSITMPSLVGLGFHPPPGWPKTLSFFVCLFICLFVRHAFERQRLSARFRHEGVGVQKRL